MAKVTDFKALKRKQMRRRSLKVLGLIALILAGTYFLSSMMSTPSFAGLSSVLDMIKGGPGYPIDAPGGKVKGMYQNESSLVMLNETTIYFYNTSGSEVYSALHRMGNPQIKTNGTMLLNYDRGSKTYAAYSRNNLFYSGKTDSAIRCGDISENGCIAIATQTENAQTQVQVQDAKQRELYTWKTDNAVTALAMSGNGSNIAIASSYVEQGELKNALTVLKNGKEQNRYELANQLILAVEFDGANVRCITDRSAFIMSPDGKIIGQFDYKGQSLAAFSMYENGVALVFGNYEQDRKYTLASVASDFFTLNGTKTLTDSIQKIKAYGNTIMVLGASSFCEYSAYDCEMIKEESNESYYDIQPMGNSIYAMTTTEIVRLPLTTPSKFSLFTNHAPKQLPDGTEEEEQSQEDLDLLAGILNGMKNSANDEEPEMTIGESEPETVYEEGFIEREEPVQSELEGEQQVEEPEPPAIDSDWDDPDDSSESVNQWMDQVPVQDEDVEPEFSVQEPADPQEKNSSSRRPAVSSNKDSDKDSDEDSNKDSDEDSGQAESSKTPQSESTKEKQQDSKSNKKDNKDEKKDEPLFSSRRPA